MNKLAWPLSISLLALIFVIMMPSKKMPIDLLLINAKIYSVDQAFSVQEAMAVHAGKIIGCGKTEDLKKRFDAKQVLDMKGAFVYPGFYDAHCHFYGYGLYSNYAQLEGTASFDEVLSIVIRYAKQHKDGWIIGRGWDQNDWTGKAFPDKKELDKLFPGRPVFLKRIDGHAAVVNQKALDLAGINDSTDIKGGKIMLKNAHVSGLLIDNAVELVQKIIPKETKEQIENALKRAEQDCLAVGLTSVDDAGLDYNLVQIIDSMQKAGNLAIKIYAMLNPSEENKAFALKHGIYKSGKLTVRCFKFYADGALGSRGAHLLSPYTDDTANTGLNLLDTNLLKDFMQVALKTNYQIATHCIGDAANRELINMYSEFLQPGNHRRWRIEHAQVVQPDDQKQFGKLGLIPSIQPTHCTSDMYWAEKRLGAQRIKYAYAYHDLMQYAGLVAAGSDFPVENINPLYGFYAAVTRQDQKGFPKKGFQKENALSREQALRAMTIWAAYSNFEEKEKGSLEPGKAADFVILNRDIMHCPKQDIFSAKVLMTFIDGLPVYERK